MSPPRLKKARPALMHATYLGKTSKKVNSKVLEMLAKRPVN